MPALRRARGQPSALDLAEEAHERAPHAARVVEVGAVAVIRRLAHDRESIDLGERGAEIAFACVVRGDDDLHGRRRRRDRRGRAGIGDTGGVLDDTRVVRKTIYIPCMWNFISSCRPP